VHHDLREIRCGPVALEIGDRPDIGGALTGAPGAGGLARFAPFALRGVAALPRGPDPDGLLLKPRLTGGRQQEKEKARKKPPGPPAAFFVP